MIRLEKYNRSLLVGNMINIRLASDIILENIFKERYGN